MNFVLKSGLTNNPAGDTILLPLSAEENFRLDGLKTLQGTLKV